MALGSWMGRWVDRQIDMFLNYITHEHMCAEEGTGSPGPGVTGTCELPNVDARN